MPIQAPRYFSPQGSFSTKQDIKVLVVSLLTFWHRPYCLKCHQPCILCCCQPQTQNLAANHSFAPSLWYLVLVKILERRHKSSISWVIWACKLVCLLGITLEKDWETWFPACGFAWSWRNYYWARLSCPVRSLEAWLSYYELVSEVFRHDKGSVDKQPSDFGIRKIVFLRFLTVSGDWGFFCKKPEDNIRS